MTALDVPSRPVTPDPLRPRPLVEVVVPVYNEERDLAASVRRLNDYLGPDFPFDVRITIADNASTDSTWAVAQALADDLPRVRAVHLAAQGRGRALRAVWSASDADVVSYMDVDLSTGLDAFLPLVAPLVTGHSDVAIGSRLRRGARVRRGAQREVISRSYNLLLRTTLGSRFSDAQCGFKALRRDAALALLPEVENESWFFDTELLVLAERNGLRIHEVPVDWVDDPDSRVDVVATALEDLRGMCRVGRRILAGTARIELPESLRRAELPAGMGRQLGSFAVIGVLSTLAYLLLYWLLRGTTGPYAANFLALLVTAVANTAANRRHTFRVRGRRDIGRQYLQGLAVFGVGLALTTGSLALLGALAPDPGRAVELGVLVAANAAATLTRFLLLRVWVFPPSRLAGRAQPTGRAQDSGGASGTSAATTSARTLRT